MRSSPEGCAQAAEKALPEVVPSVGDVDSGRDVGVVGHGVASTVGAASTGGASTGGGASTSGASGGRASLSAPGGRAGALHGHAPGTVRQARRSKLRPF